MKRIVLPVVILMAISIITVGMVIGASSGAKDPTDFMINSPADQSTGASTSTIKIVQLTSNNSGNWRHPAVAEDSKGNVLAIFRGPSGKIYFYVYCTKGGTWSSPKPIAGGNQPDLNRSLYANIKVDSTDRFHCSWEDANGAVYASFRDGVWTTPFKTGLSGRYDLTSSLALRSTDEVLTADCEVVGLSKDIYLHTKKKDESRFRSPFNLTRDFPGSTQPCIAVDSKDHIWAVWKSDFLHDGLTENLVIYLSEFDTNNADVGDRMIMSPDPAWSFLPQVAVNSEDKVMTICSTSTYGQYMSRLYNPATKKLGSLIPLNIGLCVKPWHTFFSRLTAHGTDFYAAAMTPGRLLILLKFDEYRSKWDRVGQVSDRNVEMFSLYSGYDKMFVAWNSNDETSNVFITTVEVEPYGPKVKLNSVSNLMFEKVEERSLFHRYFMYVLTWEANSENIINEITVIAQRIYRKAPTDDNSKWTRIAQVSGEILTYEDRNVSSESDYVYAVTCVDDKGNESEIF